MLTGTSIFPVNIANLRTLEQITFLNLTKPLEGFKAMLGDDFIPFDRGENDEEGVHGSTPAPPPTILTEIAAPWLAKANPIHPSTPPFVRLHNEILALTKYISPSPDEIKMRKMVFDEVSAMTLALWPNAKVKEFGSQLTSMVTPHSDIDITILNATIDPIDPYACLRALAQSMRMSGKMTYVEVITSAKMPIVKADHMCGLSIDVVINNDSGIVTGMLLKFLVLEYPHLRPLTLVLKTFLAQRKLNDTYTGGIGSFVLSSLITSYLQMRGRVEAQKGGREREKAGMGAGLARQSGNLGAMLLEVLALYGTTFNMGKLKSSPPHPPFPTLYMYMYILIVL